MSSTPTSNPWFAATIGLIGLIAGYVIASGMGGLPTADQGGNNNNAPVVAGTTGGQPNVPTPPAPSGNPAGVDDDAVLGDEDADVTLIEFTDYQCPFCSRHYTQTHMQLVKDYVDTGKVKLVVRDFPLSFHPNAQKAAEATECAEDQNKFWEMHDKLFETQGAWSNTDGISSFKQYAKDLGLNSATFDGCLDSGKYAQEVAKDMADGSASGIDGTPGFWVVGPDGKGQNISGAVPYATFKQAIDALL